MSDELWELGELVLPEGVEDLSDLTRFAGLTSLTIQNATGLDFSVLPQLTTLKTLDLSGSTLPPSTLEAIGTLPDLETLILESCAVTSINNLAVRVTRRFRSSTPPTTTVRILPCCPTA